MHITQSTYKPLKTHLESNNEPSKCIPSPVIHIRDLINKFSRGEQLDEQYHEPYYDEDPSHDSIDYRKVHNMDLVDKQEIQTQQAIKIAQQQKNIKEKIKVAEEASKKADEATKTKNNTLPPQHTQNSLKTKQTAPGSDFSELPREKEGASHGE